MLFKPEVLAPAGGMNSLIAAVRSGADAVYAGSTRFSARRNAENFDDTALRAAADYCRVRGVKLYLTLNIMIKQSELSEALRLAELAADCGVSGLILQDFGLASLIHRHLPDMPLHASTQMSVHSPAALSLLKKAGFCRVVAAREMSARELGDFCSTAARLDMEVEVFIHGALCMCVSGQCLLSAVLGGRSGNRGLCAGPCRLPFSASGGTGHDLSLKDLSLYDCVPKLADMRVASLKIEGRMKRPEYTAAATAVCRSAVDTGTVPPELMASLERVFSRSGFTDGYFNGKLGRDMFGIRTKEDVTAAAGAFPSVHDIYRTERQNVAVDVSAEIKRGHPLSLTLNDGVNTVTVKGELPQEAKNKSITESGVAVALHKLGGTPYFASACNIKLDRGLFVSASVINSLRREAVDALSALRTAVPPYRKVTVKISDEKADIRKKPLIYARFTSPDLIPGDLNGLDGIILPSEYDFPDNLPENIIKITDTPRYVLSDDALMKRLRRLYESGITYAFCGNLSTLEPAESIGFNIIGNTGLNVANGETVLYLKNMGASAVTVSPEMGMEEISSMPSALPKGIFAYGRLPLMLMRNCPVKNGTDCAQCDKKAFLTDRLGVKFPVRCRPGYSELLNSKAHYLADRLREIKNCDFLILSFTDESENEILRIIREYSFGGKASGEYTRGLYYKSVL